MKFEIPEFLMDFGKGVTSWFDKNITNDGKLPWIMMALLILAYLLFLR